MTKRKGRALKIVAGIVVSFACFVGAIVYLTRVRVVSFEMAKLMLVALLGLYVGLGVLIAAYRLMRKLQ